MTEPIRKLGRYELLQRIAKGGMGEIYLARSRGAAGFEKSCIIKTILPHLAEEEEFVTKFLDEGRIVVQLVHGNIVPVFDMGDEDGEYFIAMEYIPGRDLREVVKSLGIRHESMPVDLALYVMSEVCKGLDYAHRKTDEDGNSLNIVHRDVSPSNILISREGEVKLIDFGIARATNRLSKTVSGRIQGKFCYMSPEQASGKALDRKSDIFSAGVVLYELLTGFRPFEGETDLESLDLVRKCQYDPPSTLNSKVPEEIDAIVGRALSLDPAERYPSAGALQVELLQYLYSTGTSPTGSQLAGFLKDLFPEGLERADLRQARGPGSKPGKKMSLDEALDHELGRLLGDGPRVDPHETTAAHMESEPLVRAVKETATPTMFPDGSSGDSAESRDDQTEETAPTAPDLPSAAVTPVERAFDDEPRGFKRWIAIAAVLGIMAGAVGMVWAFMRPTEGNVRIDSDPPNALIYVDGARVLDKVTPATLELPQGDYVVELRKEGHETQRFQVPVEVGETFEIPAAEATLVPSHTLPVRTLALNVTPQNAVVTADNVKVEDGTLDIRPGDKVFLRATRAGCDTYQNQIAYEHPDDTISVALTCASSDAGRDSIEPAEEDTKTKPDRPTMVSVAIDSAPSGARLSVNGKAVGVTPLRQTWRANDLVELRFVRDGYRPFVEKRKASRFGRSFSAQLEQLELGCIKARAVYPNLATILIDGVVVSEGDSSYEGKLPVGPHEVTFRNEKIEKSQTFDIDIRAGDDCARVSWDLSE
jgi:serine/threonine protein kinase